MTHLYVACFTVLDEALKYATHSSMRYGLLNFCLGTILFWSAALPTHFTSTDVPQPPPTCPLTLQAPLPCINAPRPSPRPIRVPGHEERVSEWAGRRRWVNRHTWVSDTKGGRTERVGASMNAVSEDPGGCPGSLPPQLSQIGVSGLGGTLYSYIISYTCINCDNRCIDCTWLETGT